MVDDAHEFERVTKDVQFEVDFIDNGNVVLWGDVPIYVNDRDSTRDGVLRAITDLFPTLDPSFQAFCRKRHGVSCRRKKIIIQINLE